MQAPMDVNNQVPSPLGKRSLEDKDNAATTCAICRESYSATPETIPRVLKCGHTFCHSCISKQAIVAGTTGRWHCGVCRFDHGNTQIHQLPINFAIKQLVEDEDVEVSWLIQDENKMPFHARLLAVESKTVDSLSQDELVVVLSTVAEKPSDSAVTAPLCLYLLQRIHAEVIKTVPALLVQKTKTLCATLKVVYSLFEAQQAPIVHEISSILGTLSKDPALRNGMTPSAVDILLHMLRKQCQLQEEHNRQLVAAVAVTAEADLCLAQRASASLAHLACAFVARLDLIRCQGIQAIAKALELFFNDNVVCIGCFSALADCCVSNENQLAVARSGATRTVIAVIEDRCSKDQQSTELPAGARDSSSDRAADTQQNSGDANFDTVRAACRVLVNAAIEPSNKVLLGSLGGVEAATRVLGVYSVNAKVTFLAAATLCNLSALLSNCTIGGKCGAVMQLAQALQRFPNDLQIVESATGALCNLSSSNDCKAQMISANVLSLLASCHRFINHGKIMEGVLGAFASLAATDAPLVEQHCARIIARDFLNRARNDRSHPLPLYPATEARARTLLSRLNAHLQKSLTDSKKSFE